MGLKEKLAETVEIRTAADEGRIWVAADRAAEAAKVVGTSKVSALEPPADGSRLFKITVPVTGVRQMVFGVSVVPAGNGTNKVSTEIHECTTSQQKLLMLIPIGPKIANGLKAYRRFMKALDTELAAL